MISQASTRLAKLKQIVRPMVPVGLIDMRARQAAIFQSDEAARKAQLVEFRGCVQTTIDAIGNLTDNQSTDTSFLEHELIPMLGLNDEETHEQPPELSAYFGKGLHLWQYPSQLAVYLSWLAKNAAGITSYLEIGCRWGGMLVLTAEWLRRHGAELSMVIGVDPIEPAPFVEEYFRILREQESGRKRPIEAIYLQDLSTSPQATDFIRRVRPDFVYIDGDHSLKGALTDHMLVRDFARVIVHHDISSQSCPDVSFLWGSLKQLEGRTFGMVEFTDQYPSVQGNYLGIGVMKRRGQE